MSEEADGHSHLRGAMPSLPVFLTKTPCLKGGYARVFFPLKGVAANNVARCDGAGVTSADRREGVPGKFQLSGPYPNPFNQYRLYSEAVFGNARSVPLWHAELSRTISRVEIKLAARDLLNRNVGVNYSNTSSYIEEEHVATLGRYVMLQVVYNLSGVARRNRMRTIEM